MREEVLLFGPGQSVAGVLTPAVAADKNRNNTAVIIVTAGLLHHVGPHRMHVLLARELAKHGIGALRFDFSGIGDSSPRPDSVPAHEMPVHEINEAIGELEKRGFNRFILFGICSGAVQAKKAALNNPKIAGVIVVNTGSDTSSKSVVNPQFAAQFYLKRSLKNPNAWKNLVTGKVKYRALFTTLVSAVAQKIKAKGKCTLSFGEVVKRDLKPLIEQGTSILEILSDRHAQYYELHWPDMEALQGEYFQIHVVAETDHLFTSLEAQRALIQKTCQWSGEVLDNSAGETA